MFYKFVFYGFLFIVDYSVIYAFNKSTCHRLIPTYGQWSDEPPYWIPHGCKTQAFDVSATQKCMSGRTLYVIGNSVPRQSAFGMIDMLGGGSVKREGQRDMCPKHETTWGDSCHKEFAGCKIRYLFLQFMDGFYYSDRGGFPFLKHKNETTILPNDPNTPRVEQKDGDVFWAEDSCITKPLRTCMAEFFNGSMETDILMFTLGMPYSQKSNVLEMESWLRSSAAAFRAHLAGALV